MFYNDNVVGVKRKKKKNPTALTRKKKSFQLQTESDRIRFKTQCKQELIGLFRHNIKPLVQKNFAAVTDLTRRVRCSGH